MACNFNFKYKTQCLGPITSYDVIVRATNTIAGLADASASPLGTVLGTFNSSTPSGTFTVTNTTSVDVSSAFSGSFPNPTVNNQSIPEDFEVCFSVIDGCGSSVLSCENVIKEPLEVQSRIVTAFPDNTEPLFTITLGGNLFDGSTQIALDNGDLLRITIPEIRVDVELIIGQDPLTLSGYQNDNGSLSWSTLIPHLSSSGTFTPALLLNDSYSWVFNKRDFADAESLIGVNIGQDYTWNNQVIDVDSGATATSTDQTQVLYDYYLQRGFIGGSLNQGGQIALTSGLITRNVDNGADGRNNSGGVGSSATACLSFGSQTYTYFVQTDTGNICNWNENQLGVISQVIPSSPCWCPSGYTNQQAALAGNDGVKVDGTMFGMSSFDSRFTYADYGGSVTVDGNARLSVFPPLNFQNLADPSGVVYRIRGVSDFQFLNASNFVGNLELYSGGTLDITGTEASRTPSTDPITPVITGGTLLENVPMTIINNNSTLFTYSSPHFLNEGLFFAKGSVDFTDNQMGAEVMTVNVVFSVYIQSY